MAPPLVESQQSYYPMARVRLNVRFEDFSKEDTSGIIPKKPTSLRKGTGGAASLGATALEYKEEVDDLGISRYVLTPKGASRSGGPQEQETSEDLKTHTVGGIVPLKASHTRNGIKQADTFTCEFAFTDLPCDPRAIRSCAVEYYLGSLSPEAYQSALSNVNGTFIPDSYNDQDGATRTNLRFQGWVDEWEVEYPGGGDAIVKFQCRDNTQIFIDQFAPPKLTLDTALPLNEAVAKYLAAFPQFAGMSVAMRPSTQTAPVLKDALQTVGLKKQVKAGSPAGDGKTNVFEYLTDIIGQCGFVLFVEDTTVVIQTPRTVFGTGYLREGDPFQGRELPNGTKAESRWFVYGRNVENLSVTRKYNVKGGANAEIRCYDPMRKRTLVARYPSDATGNEGKGRQTQALPGDAGEKKWNVYRIDGVTNMDTLKLIAQSHYEQASRSELVCKLSTCDLSSYGGSALDCDVLDMQAGDPFELLLASSPESGGTSSSYFNLENKALSRMPLVEYLYKIGFSTDFALGYTLAYSNNAMQTLFRTNTIRTDWDIDKGVKIGIEGINYVEARMDENGPNDAAKPARKKG
jgi:hypothetical protein